LVGLQTGFRDVGREIHAKTLSSKERPTAISRPIQPQCQFPERHADFPECFHYISSFAPDMSFVTPTPQ
jgi:hypothetical protein